MTITMTGQALDWLKTPSGRAWSDSVTARLPKIDWAKNLTRVEQERWAEQYAAALAGLPL